MDRMNCQFLMTLCTWVHYNTFVEMENCVGASNELHVRHFFNELEQLEFLEQITKVAVTKEKFYATR